eukprot:1465622-Pyramimonas_sp.AAC.2
MSGGAVAADDGGEGTVHEVVTGAFSRYNTGIDASKFGDEHARKFYQYLHEHGERSLGKELSVKRRLVVRPT